MPQPSPGPGSAPGGVPSVPAAAVDVGVVPRWDLDDLVTRTCPACGGGRGQGVCVRPDGLLVEACHDCEMMFVKRIPSGRQLADFYGRYAGFKGYSRTRALSFLQCAAACSQDLYIEALEQTGGLAGRSVIDLGCSAGRFLELVRYKGGIPLGVEIDASARAEAASRGLQVLEAAPDDGQFDVTTILQVLEHLPQPGELLATAARLTRPAGRVLVAVPNAGEVAQLGPDWIGFRVDLEHLNYFTARTLAAMLRRHGLLVEHVWQHRQPALGRNDLASAGPAGLPARLRQGAQRAVERALRALFPPPERFQEGTFVLSVLARPAAVSGAARAP